MRPAILRKGRGVLWQDENTPLPRPQPIPESNSLDHLLKPSPAFVMPLRPSFRPTHPITPVTAINSPSISSVEEEERGRAPSRAGGVPPPRRGSLGALRRQVWDNLKREGGDQQQRRDFTPPTRLPARSLLHPAMLHERKSLSPPPRGTARSQLSRPPHSSTSQEAIDVNGFQRLSTEGLSPLQHHLRSSGTIEIVPSSSSTSLPSLLVDVRTRIGLVYLISGDGSKVSLSNQP